MSKMKSFQVIALTLSMLMTISMVKGRWLDLETYSKSMITVGVHNISNQNPPNLHLEFSNSSTFYAEKRCESLYGFFPCADTMLESVFLMIMYMYFMILGDELMRTGSKVLFQWIGDRALGESVFGVLKALPKIAVFVVPGVLSSASDAQNKVVFGVSMYAGTTVITLTLVWGIYIIKNRDKLKEISSRESDHQQDSSSRLKLKQGSSRESDHQQDSSIKCLSLLTDMGVNIDNETGDMALIMLLSLIPFFFAGLLHFINTPAMTLFTLIVSVVSLLLYFGYQVKNSWIRFRSLAYLNQENLRTRFFYHVIWLSDFEDVVDKQGNFDVTCFERIFDEADKVIKDKCISSDELGCLVQKLFMLKQDDQKSKEAILIHFDRNEDKKICWDEFKRGCTKWLDEAISSGSGFENIWNQAKERNKQRSDIRIIEKMMRKILKQVLERHELVEDGKPDTVKIKGLFSQHDKDGDDVIHRDDLKKLIETLVFGKALDHDKLVLDELVKKFGDDKNQSVDKEEFLGRFIKWIDQKTIDPKEAIEKFEEDNQGKIHALLKPEKPKATIVYAIFGIAITITIASPFITSVKQFSTAAHIPFLFTSFVMAPIAMKAKMAIVKLLNYQKGVRKNASLKFSEIYDQLVMDNLLGLLSLLAVVYIKGLSWTYSSEVLAIVIPCAIVGLFAFKRDNYPLWASFLAILLYPVSVCIYYVCKHYLTN